MTGMPLSVNWIKILSHLSSNTQCPMSVYAEHLVAGLRVLLSQNQFLERHTAQDWFTRPSEYMELHRLYVKMIETDGSIPQKKYY